MIAWARFKFAAGLAALLIFVAGTASITAQKVVESKRLEADEARRSTPAGALRYLLDAFVTFDETKIIDSHATNSAAMQRMLHAMAAAMAAEGRLQKALEDRFKAVDGNQIPSVQRGILNPARGQWLMQNRLPPDRNKRLQVGPSQFDNAQEQITNNTATVTVPGRAETYHFVRIGKVWKITDPERGLTLTDAEPMARRLDQAARAYTELTEAIRRGNFQSATEAIDALRARMMADLQKP
jgi:hypothetical protein